MANYEIMLLVSGSLKEPEANKVASEIATSIKTCKPQVTEYGQKKLAYKIKKDDTAYYYQYNFECESPAMINEFRRLATINKYVLRQLIINLEKDYLYRASINPKKVERNKKTAEIHQRIKAKIEEQKALKNSEKAQKFHDFEKAKAEKDSSANKLEKSSETKKTSKTNKIPEDKQHVTVSMIDFENYNYDKRRKEWHEKAGHNEKQVVCSVCNDDDNWETILLENGKHVCYYCWIKKPEDVASTKKTKAATAKASTEAKKTTKTTKAKK